MRARSWTAERLVPCSAHADQCVAADIFDRVSPSLAQLGVDTEVCGGGRIRHTAGESLFVYGYSVVYDDVQ